LARDEILLEISRDPGRGDVKVSTWQAGAVEVEITPPLDVPLGSGFNPPRVEGIADPLVARALVLSDGVREVALANADILAIDPLLSRQVRTLVEAESGIPRTHVMVSATHTHSCGGRLQPSRGNGDPALIEIMARHIAGAVAAARRDLRPAVLTAGVVTVDGVTCNRRDPGATIDRTLRVLRVDGDEGPMAVVTTFPCHPILVARDRPVLSADFPGVLAHTIKAVLGRSVVVLPTNGACGDVNPVFPYQGGLDSARWIGQTLGGEAVALLARLEAAGRSRQTENTRWGLTLELGDDGTAPISPPSLRVATAIARIPAKRFPSPETSAKACEDAAASLIAAGVGPDIVAIWQTGRYVPAESERTLRDADREARRSVVAELLRHRAEGWAGRVVEHQGTGSMAHRELELQAFGLGDQAGILAVPFELFSRVGLDILAASPFRHLFLIGYSNDLGGYLMPDAEYDRGGFEPGITFYGRGAAAAVREASLSILEKVHAGYDI
jgi:hypothetical protein